MIKEMKPFLMIVNNLLETKSILESHCIDYDEKTDYFVLHVVIGGVLHSKPITGLDSDIITPDMWMCEAEQVAKNLIATSNKQLIEIIYSN